MSTANLTFSLIVNTIDRANALRTLLYALEQQSYPRFEVIVVVGPTRDHTLEMLQEFNGRIRLLRCPTANLSQSRNIGLHAARGDIVAYIDDDAVPSYHWLAQLARLFANPNLVGTGGKVYCIRPDKPFVQHHLGLSSGLAEQIDSRDSALANLPPPGEGYQWVTRMMGTNMAYRRCDLLAVGGFDEFFQWVYDDTDIALELVNAGKIVQPVRQAVVYHIPASSRNREVSTAVGNWWIQTKAGVYFCLKHGRRGGNSWRDITLRCLHLWHGHLLWYSHLRREGRLSLGRHWQMRGQEVRGVLSGVYYGWQRLRQPAVSHYKNNMDQTKPIEPFLTDTSARQPAVDPVSGRRPEITLPDLPLRLCLLSMAYPPRQYEGVGRLTNLMAQSLFELGHTVHVITHAEAEAVSFYDGAYVHATPFRRDRYERYRLFPRLHTVLNYSHTVYEKVRQLQLNDGIQLVDSPLWQVDGLVTAVSGTLPTVVRLVTAAKQIDGLRPDQDSDARLLGEMEKSLIRRADHLLPNTQATLNAVQTVYDVDTRPDQYTIVPYGIIPAPDEAIRPFPVDASPEELTVLYVGRLEKRKGIADLFAAIPIVLDRLPQARFVVVGADNSHRDDFQKQHGLDYPTYFRHVHPRFAGRVTFTGAVSDEVLQNHYQNCHLFVAPSLYESFGLIYLEAMNYAKPVIGCRAGGVPEVVADGENGLLVEPEAPAQLAAAILALLQSPTKLREMGLAGRRRLLDQFTHLAMARRFTTVYRQVIAAQRN
jgi:glycosyltransferase involved in cell wall biosynthesis